VVIYTPVVDREPNAQKFTFTSATSAIALRHRLITADDRTPGPSVLSVDTRRL
jgi:hypothetical protein